MNVKGWKAPRQFCTPRLISDLSTIPEDDEETFSGDLCKMGRFNLVDCDDFAYCAVSSGPPRHHRLKSYPNELFDSPPAAASASLKKSGSSSSCTRSVLKMYSFSRVSDVSEHQIMKVRAKFMISTRVVESKITGILDNSTAVNKKNLVNTNNNFQKKLQRKGSEVLTHSVAVCGAAGKIMKRLYGSKILGLEDSKGFLKMVSIGFLILCTRFFSFRR